MQNPSFLKSKIPSKLLAVYLFVAIGLIILLLLITRSPIHPVAWQSSFNPQLSGSFKENNLLDNSTVILNNVGIGPEDITYGPNGRFYTGYSDGRIVSFILDETTVLDLQEFTNTGGRPLGLKFDNKDNLIVADADKGLLSISPDGNITVLTDSVNGIKMKFVDHLDIAKDGTIWFSDATQRFEHSDFVYDFLEVSSTGRLLSYSPDTKQTQVHLSDLFFANGVVVGPEDEFVLINETGKAQIVRLWLKGENKGEREVFIKNLPSMPDNITFNGKDTFWVGLINLREPFIDALSSYPLLRKLIAGLPKTWLKPMREYSIVLGIDVEGNVVANYQGDNKLYAITSAYEFENKLILGSLKMPSAAILNLPNSTAK